MELNITEFLKLQHDLDLKIIAKHGVTYETTKDERLLALYTELGELANATRAFKYWSTKEAEPHDVLLDEFADGLHFFFSLALAHELEIPAPIVTLDEEETLTKRFLRVYKLVTNFRDEPNVLNFMLAMRAYLTLGKALNFTLNEIKGAYLEKMVVNYKRQEESY